jgi:hypothetical protein
MLVQDEYAKPLPSAFSPLAPPFHKKTRLTKGSGVFLHNKLMLVLTRADKHHLAAAADLSLEDQP